MVINHSLYGLIHSLVFKASNDEVKKMRVDGLKKIFESDSAELNLSQFIGRLKDKTLGYQQSKKMIKWFGAIVYDMKTNDKYCKIATGHIEVIEDGEVIYIEKSFVCECRILDTYLDAMLHSYTFSTHKVYKKVTFTDFEIEKEDEVSEEDGKK